MLDQVAFQIGAFFTLASLIFTFTIWILAAVNRLRIESIGVLNAPWIQLYKVKIKSVEIILGWLPLGSLVKISGMMDETLEADSNSNADDIPSYKFRSRPLRTRLLIVMTSPLLLSLMGLLLLNATPFPLLEWVTIYLEISFFQLPLETGASIWDAFQANPIFLLGSIFFYLGIGNIGSNFGSALNNDTLTWLFLFLLILFLFLSLTTIRLAWSTFSLLNLSYFLLGSLLAAIIGFLVAILLAKFLPNA
jgi:hypothetical protein